MLQCFDPPGLLDLVHDMSLDRYQIRAEVRHETDQMPAGPSAYT